MAASSNLSADMIGSIPILILENSIFKKIFDTFDEFNFTIKEDEPLEKEVAVDPETLGKIFENLLEENLRKGLWCILYSA